MYDDRSSSRPDAGDRQSGGNGSYHYLGAAKILTPIGKAFAEALLNLQKTQGDVK